MGCVIDAIPFVTGGFDCISLAATVIFLPVKSFTDILSDRVDSTHSRLCVGLDIDRERLRSSDGRNLDRLASFSRMVVDATLDYAVAYKLNLAFFERYGKEGYGWLENLLNHIDGRRLMVADGKRGDIASSAEHYAFSLFERFGFDAVTVNPYMGRDAIEPFLHAPERGVFVICLTSNETASDLQLRRIGGDPLYAKVIDLVKSLNRHRNCGLVVGATRSDQLRAVRQRAGDMPLLLPGVGAQGGDLAMSVREGNRGGVALIAVSRSLLYSGDQTHKAIAQRARHLRDDINHHVEHRASSTGGDLSPGE